MNEDDIFDPRIFHRGSSRPRGVVIEDKTEDGRQLFYQTQHQTEIFECLPGLFSVWYFGIRLGVAKLDSGKLRIEMDGPCFADELLEIAECLSAIEKHLLKPS